MISDLVKEISSVKEFFLTRAGLGDCGGHASLKSSFTTALVVQINAMVALSADDATALHEALKDVPYGEDGIQKIMRAIDAKNPACSMLETKAQQGRHQRAAILEEGVELPNPR